MFHGPFMVLPVRIELTTSPLPRGCSTTELRQRRAGCGNLKRFECGRERRDPCHKAGTGASARRPIRAPFHAVPDARILPVMNERPKAAEKARRQRRLSAVLRENLKRRKAQAKGRSAAAPDRAPHDSAGIAADKRDS